MLKEKVSKKKASVEDEIQNYLKSNGLTFQNYQLSISVDAGEGDFAVVKEQDFEFAALFDAKLDSMLEEAKQSKNQTLFLSALRLMSGKSKQFAKYLSWWADIIVTQVETEVVKGEYQPLYALEGKNGVKTNEWYVAEWLRKVNKYFMWEPEVRVTKALYFGKGFVNRGTIDYSAAYSADRDSHYASRARASLGK